LVYICRSYDQKSSVLFFDSVYVQNERTIAVVRFDVDIPSPNPSIPMPKIRRIGQPPGSKVCGANAQHRRTCIVYSMKAHGIYLYTLWKPTVVRKRHARDAQFVDYRAACGRKSACVDMRPSQKTDILVTIYDRLTDWHTNFAAT